MSIPKSVIVRLLVGFILVVGTIAVFPKAPAVAGDSSANNANKAIAAAEKNFDYLVNEQGQTYGHGPYPSGQTRELDLIKAEGENGIVGYVKAADLAPRVSSPEEAIAYQESVEADGGYTSIPLYKLDGQTVIGKFRLYLNYSVMD